MIKRKQKSLHLRKPIVELLDSSAVRGQGSNLRPSGYKPEESIAICGLMEMYDHCMTKSKMEA